MSSVHACRLCGAPLTRTFVDLGMSPLCESYLPAERLDEPETFYPLHVRLCARCLLVQLPAYVPGEDIFSDYAYFSSYSDSWVAHAKRYADAMIDRLGLTPGSLVTEVASNDGYLLQHFAARQASRCSASSRPPTWPRPPGPRASATEVQFLGPETGPRDRRRVRPGRPGGRQQRLRPRPRHPRLRGRAARAGQGHRPGDAGVPAPAPADRAAPVRHDLPRALLLPVAADLVPRAGHGRAARGRRRRAGHPRRVAAGARPARGERRRAEQPGQGGAGRRGGGRAAHGRPGTRASPARC